jgi:hypothetical protein
VPRTRIALALVTVSAFTAAALGSACAELVGIGDLPGPAEAGSDASTDSTTDAAGDAEDAKSEDTKKPMDAGLADASADGAGDTSGDAGAGDTSDERGDGDGTLGQVLPAHTPPRPGRDGRGRDRVTLDLGEIKLHVWQT